MGISNSNSPMSVHHCSRCVNHHHYSTTAVANAEARSLALDSDMEAICSDVKAVFEAFQQESCPEDLDWALTDPSIAQEPLPNDSEWSWNDVLIESIGENGPAKSLETPFDEGFDHDRSQLQEAYSTARREQNEKQEEDETKRRNDHAFLLSLDHTKPLELSTDGVLCPPPFSHLPELVLLDRQNGDNEAGSIRVASVDNDIESRQPISKPQRWTPGDVARERHAAEPEKEQWQYDDVDAILSMLQDDEDMIEYTNAMVLEDFADLFDGDEAWAKLRATHGSAIDASPCPQLPELVLLDHQNGDHQTGSQRVASVDHDDQCSESKSKPRRWTPDEAARLRHAVETEKEKGSSPVSWKVISSKYFGGTRNENQCKAHWRKMQRRPTTWTEEEDDFILDCHNAKLSWEEIASRLPGDRLPDQVRDRFKNHVDPNLKKGPFSMDEKAILFQAQREVGNSWTKIAARLPGRTDTQVKNYWHNAKMSHRRKLCRTAQ
ncbi:hypothetical protein ACA910_021574 [Epithemia clementina (nom. ined.)]